VEKCHIEIELLKNPSDWRIYLCRYHSDLWPRTFENFSVMSTFTISYLCQVLLQSLH